jgi:hypothetical protein
MFIFLFRGGGGENWKLLNQQNLMQKMTLETARMRGLRLVKALMTKWILMKNSKGISFRHPYHSTYN